ncbi:hypothetical protein RHSIM_Rhsim12G0009700 [Rhododendron simsii]|uniref:Uncharacterized protein n=1 Tax=Rhododendron simsii TaxID=118357 RepID=A0A834L8L7_RHOSS|nr:hypothetical protein RHSIM_Rhsim12G0009700 [Rhododendron simsii]
MIGQTHGVSIAMWDNRGDHIVQGEAYDGVMHRPLPTLVRFNALPWKACGDIMSLHSIPIINEVFGRRCSLDVQLHAYTLAVEALRAHDEHHRLSRLGVSYPLPAQDLRCQEEVNHSYEEQEAATQAEEENMTSML